MTEEDRYQVAWKRREVWSRLDHLLSLPSFVFVALLPYLYYWYQGRFPMPFLIFGTVLLGAALIAALRSSAVPVLRSPFFGRSTSVLRYSVSFLLRQLRSSRSSDANRICRSGIRP